MKNYKFLALLLSVSLFAACAANKQVSLTLNLPQNERFNYSNAQDMEINVNIMGMDQQTLSNQVFEFEHKVLDNRANGDMKIVSTIKNVQISQTSAGGTIYYDSKDKTNNEPADMAKMYDAMLGHIIYIGINKTGEFTSMEGNDSMIEKMTANMPEVGGMDKGQLKQLVSSQFDEKSMQNMLGSITGIYPDNAVKVGDQWTKSDTLSGTIDMIINATYTLKERKSGKAYIDVSGTISPNKDAKGATMMGMTIKYMLTGTLNGKVTLDEKTGWADYAEIIKDAKGTMQMNSPQLGNIDAKMSMKTKSVNQKL